MEWEACISITLNVWQCPLLVRWLVAPYLVSLTWQSNRSQSPTTFLYHRSAFGNMRLQLPDTISGAPRSDAQYFSFDESLQLGQLGLNQSITNQAWLCTFRYTLSCLHGMFQLNFAQQLAVDIRASGSLLSQIRTVIGKSVPWRSFGYHQAIRLFYCALLFLEEFMKTQWLINTSNLGSSSPVYSCFHLIACQYHRVGCVSGQSSRCCNLLGSRISM